MANSAFEHTPTFTTPSSITTANSATIWSAVNNIGQSTIILDSGGNGRIGIAADLDLLALASGALTVSGTIGSGAITSTGVITATGFTIGSAVIIEAELEMLDGITAGTAAASKALVLDSNKDIGIIRNLTINGTLSDGNYTFDTSGNVSGLGTIGSGAITSTGVVTATGFTIGSAAITEAELEILDGASVSTTELNLLDALDRGSIIYGNASSVTTVLGQGAADTVLTSDGDDIAWQAPAASGLTVQQLWKHMPLGPEWTGAAT